MSLDVCRDLLYTDRKDLVRRAVNAHDLFGEALQEAGREHDEVGAEGVNDVGLELLQVVDIERDDVFLGLCRVADLDAVSRSSARGARQGNTRGMREERRGRVLWGWTGSGRSDVSYTCSICTSMTQTCPTFQRILTVRAKERHHHAEEMVALLSHVLAFGIQRPLDLAASQGLEGFVLGQDIAEVVARHRRPRPAALAAAVNVGEPCLAKEGDQQPLDVAHVGSPRHLTCVGVVEVPVQKSQRRKIVARRWRAEPVSRLDERQLLLPTRRSRMASVKLDLKTVNLAAHGALLVLVDALGELLQRDANVQGRWVFEECERRCLVLQDQRRGSASVLLGRVSHTIALQQGVAPVEEPPSPPPVPPPAPPPTSLPSFPTSPARPSPF